MTDFLTWRDDWQTGIDQIDDDHRRIVVLLNQLVAASERATRDPHSPDPQTPQDDCLATLDALIEHCRRHFQAEESFLLEIGFPDYNGHRCEHVLQLAEFTEMRRALAEDGNPFLGADTLEGLKRWFFNHVIAEDRGYVDYYRNELGSRPAA